MQPRLEVADVFRDGASQFLRQYGRHHSVNQHRTLGAVIHCRTAQLGGKSQHCPDCGHQRIQYHSCRNRHCPKCQGMARAAWVDQRETELLPVPYFHVVFTLPQQLAPLALQNKRVMYEILFRAAAETLQQLAADPIDACIANVLGRPTEARLFRPSVGRPGSLAMQTPISILEYVLAS